MTVYAPLIPAVQVAEITMHDKTLKIKKRLAEDEAGFVAELMAVWGKSKTRLRVEFV
jgi:hypothetical protein